jgi:ABC-type multidrug transport system fused ATPase/permease subunit
MNLNNDLFRILRKVLTQTEKKIFLSWLLIQMFTVTLDLSAIVITGIVVSTFIPIIQSKPNNIPILVQKMYENFNTLISIYEFIFMLILTASVILVARSFISVNVDRYFSNKLCVIHNRLLKSILTYHYNQPLDKRIQLSEVKLLNSIHGSLNSLVHYVIGNFILILSEIFSLLIILTVIFVWKPFITSILLLIILAATLLSFIFHIKKSQLMLSEYSNVSTSLSAHFLQIDSLSTDLILRSQFRNYLAKYTDQRLVFSKLISARIIQFGFPRLILESSLIIGGLVTSLLAWYLLSVSEALIVLTSFLILGFRILPAILKVQNGIQTFLQHKDSSILALDILDFYSHRFNSSLKITSFNNILPTETNSLFLNNLTYSFLTGEKLFDNFELNILNNGMYLIKGQNGVGKSTLFEIISGFRVPSNGSVTLNGLDITLASPEDRGKFLSYLPQKQIFTMQSLLESFFIIEDDGERQLELVEKCLDILTTLNFDLAKYDLSKIMDLNLILSEGEKQKIGLARTFVRNSPILLLDEPTNNLDYVSKASLLSLIRKESANRIILMITHESKFDDFANEIFYL